MLIFSRGRPSISLLCMFDRGSLVVLERALTNTGVESEVEAGFILNNCKLAF